MTNIFALPITEKISSVLSLRQLDQLTAVVIDHPKVRAAISLQGAHLLAWQPEGEQPVIWLSETTAFTPQVAIRGGVPICWPWFGKIATPSHGFARILPWELTAHDEDASGVILTFTLKESAETKKHWPHDFTLLARFKLGETCEIELESHGDYQATAALHTYFQIGDISQIKISGLGGPFIDKVAGNESTQSEDLTFNGQTDRVYTHPEHSSLIVDPSLRRTIEVHHHHHSDVVAWNPGEEIAQTLADMPDNGYQTMVCVETARVSQPLVATAESPSRLSVTIRSRKHS